MIKFGTGGFRGIIGEDFTRENVELIAEALARIAEEDGSDKPVVIGYDNRFDSDRASVWAAEVLAAHGLRVLKFERPMPTPAIMYAVKSLGLDYGMTITASHNPYYFNGVKLFVKEGMDADVAFTERLEEKAAAVKGVEALDISEAAERGLVEKYDNFDGYLGFIRSFILPDIVDNRIKILYDNLYGVGCPCLEALAKRYRISQFDVMHGNHDAFFGFSLPNPTEEMMKPLAEKVVREGYDFGMATDSDADRLGIVDEGGRYVDNNDILAALYYYLSVYRGMKGDVVKNCATSLLIDKLAERLGRRCHEVDVGFKNVSQKMAETDALIGGESSGGLTVRGYVRGKDSVFSASLFMEMAVMMKKPISEIIREVHEFAGYTLCSGESVIEVKSLEPVREFLCENLPGLSEPVLGTKHFGRNFKYFLEGGWALLRMSGTEPALRIFAETGSREETKRVIGELTASLKRFA